MVGSGLDACELEPARLRRQAEQLVVVLEDPGRAVGRGNYYSSLVAGDDKIFACSERGVLTVLAADGKWKVESAPVN